mmetsp:Transcript_5912/g.20123  ORF Transcript_5912/g.20123 Transcript_5912/m.20123 type:complete len:271 (+) Transcript_5912:242-1054(+)
MRSLKCGSFRGRVHVKVKVGADADVVRRVHGAREAVGVHGRGREEHSARAEAFVPNVVDLVPRHVGPAPLPGGPEGGALAVVVRLASRERVRRGEARAQEHGHHARLVRRAAVHARDRVRICVEISQEEQGGLGLGPAAAEGLGAGEGAAGLREELVHLLPAPVLPRLAALRGEVRDGHDRGASRRAVLEGGDEARAARGVGPAGVHAHEAEPVAPPREHHAVRVVPVLQARRVRHGLVQRVIPRGRERRPEEVVVLVHLLQGEESGLEA